MAQIYRIGKDVYDAATNQRIPDVATLTSKYYGAKEIAAPKTTVTPPAGSVAIPGAKYNTKELQQAAFSNIVPIGGTLYGTPKVPESINETMITETPKVTPMTPEQSTTDAFVAGLGEANRFTSDLYKAQEAQRAEEMKGISSIQSRVGELIGETGGKGAALTRQYEALGVPEQTKQLAELNTQIAKTKAMYDTQAEQIRQSSGLTRIIGGSVDKLARQQAIEMGNLSTMAQAVQGNIAAAKQTAADTINQEFEAKETELKLKQQQLADAYNNLSVADKKRADQLNMVYQLEQNKIEEEKENKNQVYQIMITAAQNGADNATLNNIKNAKNIGEAILSSGQYIKTQEKGSWDQFTNPNDGSTYLLNKTTGSVKNISNVSANLGEQIGEKFGLPTYNTRDNNPGVTRSNRNNNPGNIKASEFSISFPGVVGVESSPAADGGNFLIFDSAESGLKAMEELFLTGKSYKNVNAETAIKRYNGNGSYGAATVGLNPNASFQDQIKDPEFRKTVVSKIAQAEGFTGVKTTQAESSEEDWATLIEKKLAKITNVPKAKQDKVNAILADRLVKSQAVSSSASNNAQALLLVKELIEDPNREAATGASAWRANIPTSGARSFARKVDRLTGLLTLDSISQMKGLGALSDAEGKRLENSMSILKDRYLSESDYLEELRRVEQTLNKASKFISGTQLGTSSQEPYPVGTILEQGGRRYRYLGNNEVEEL